MKKKDESSFHIEKMDVTKIIPPMKNSFFPMKMHMTKLFLLEEGLNVR